MRPTSINGDGTRTTHVNACAVNFARAYDSAPICVVSLVTASVVNQVGVTTSKTVMTLTSNADLASAEVIYLCVE